MDKEDVHLLGSITYSKKTPPKRGLIAENAGSAFDAL